MVKRIIAVMGFITCAFSAAAEVSEAALIGVWQCGPYEMSKGGMSITTWEQRKYLKDGGFSEVSTSRLQFANGSKTTMSIKLEGRWSLADKVVTAKFDKATFLSSDNPRYTIAMGQQQADKQMATKNWAKNLIDIQGDKMIYIPVESMYKEAEVVVSCVNPVRSSGLE